MRKCGWTRQLTPGPIRWSMRGARPGSGARPSCKKHGSRWLVTNPPQMPLSTPELDRVAELSYVREPHPMYDSMGGVPAIEEVFFQSLTTAAASVAVTSAPWRSTKGG